MSNPEQELKYLKIIAEQYKWHKIMLRSLMTGLFTAVGATVGFALVLLLSARVISTIRDFPIIDVVLKETKLDILIEKQLELFEEATNNPPKTPVSNPK